MPVFSTTSVPTSVTPLSSLPSTSSERISSSSEKGSTTSTTITSFNIQNEVPSVSVPKVSSTPLISGVVEDSTSSYTSTSTFSDITFEHSTSTFSPPTSQLATSSIETEFSTETSFSISTEPIVVSVDDLVRILNGTDTTPIVEGTSLLIVYLVCGSFACAVLLVILGGLIHFCVKRSKGVLYVTSNTQRKTIRIPSKFNNQLIRIRKTHSVVYEDPNNVEMVDINGIPISTIEPIRVNNTRDNNDAHGGYAIPFPEASCSSFQLPSTSVRKQPHFIRKQLTQVTIHSPPPIPIRSSSSSSSTSVSRHSTHASASSSQFGVFSRGSSIQSHDSITSNSSRSNTSTLTRSSLNRSITRSNISVSDLTDRTLSNLVSRQVSTDPDGDDVTLSGMDTVHDSSLSDIYL